MRLKSALPLAAVFVVTLCASDLLAQKEFDEAREKIAAFWGETSKPINDPAQREKVTGMASELPGTIKPLIDSGILSYLNETRTVSIDELTLKISAALSYPYETSNTLADANNEVSVIPLPDRNGYAIAYDIATCASCSTSWVEIVARRDDRWVFTDHLDNPATDDAIHLGWVGPETAPLLAVYGIHWGDAHNRLDVRIYSVNDGIMPVWSSLDLSQGEIAIQGDRITLKFWTQPTPWADTTKPYREEQQVFEVNNRQVKLLETKFPSPKK